MTYFGKAFDSCMSVKLYIVNIHLSDIHDIDDMHDFSDVTQTV